MLVIIIDSDNYVFLDGGEVTSCGSNAYGQLGAPGDVTDPVTIPRSVSHMTTHTHKYRWIYRVRCLVGSRYGRWQLD